MAEAPVVESPGKSATPPPFNLSSGGADTPPSDPSKGGGASKRAGKAAATLELLGADGTNLTYSFASQYASKLIKEHNPAAEVVILLGDVVMHFWGPSITSAEGFMTKLASLGISFVAPALKWLELARTIISRISQFIERIPAPIREFLKYVMGFGLKKFGDIASRITLWLAEKTRLPGLTALSQKFVVEDWVINKAIFGASSLYGSVQQLLTVLDYLVTTLEAVTNVLKGIVEKSMSMASGAFSAFKFAYRLLGGRGSAVEPSADKAQATPQKQPQVASSPPKEKDIDLKFLRLLVTSPTVQKWEETMQGSSAKKEHGGIVLNSQLEFLLGGLDFQATVNVKIDYSGAYDFTLETKTPLFAEGTGIDGLITLEKLQLSKLGISSTAGMHTLEVDLGALTFGDNTLVGKDLHLGYHKGKPDALQVDAPLITLNAFGESFKGKLNLGFKDNGHLNTGAFSLVEDKTVQLFGDHLKLNKLKADGTWANGAFESVLGSAGIELNVPNAHLTGDTFTVGYKKAMGVYAEAAKMGIVLDIQGAQVTVELDEAHVDKDGFGAKKVSFAFKKPQAGAEAQPSDASQVAKQASFLQSAIPGFDLSWITKALDIEHFDMQVSNARIGEKAKARTADSDAVAKPQIDAPVQQTPVVQATPSQQAPVVGSGAPAEKKATNAFRLNALKATAFGFTVDGQYKEATSKFEGTIASERFGLAKGEAPATFAVGKNGEQWEADVQNLKWANVAPFGLFKADAITVTQLKLVSGLGIQTLGLTIQNLNFGNGTLNVGAMTGTLKNGVLEVMGNAIQLSLFGQPMTGAFSIKVDRSGKPQEIKASLGADTDIDAIAGVLKLKKVGGALEWKDGKLADAGIHGDMDVSLLGGALSANSSGLKFGYVDGTGMFAEADALTVKANITDKLQLLLQLNQGRVAKVGGGLAFKAGKVAASLSYGKPLFSSGAQNIDSTQMKALLPNMATDWLDFAGVEAVGFTLSADDIVVNKEGLAVKKWNKVLDVFQAKVAGFEFGYNKDGAQLDSQAGSARRVEQPVSQDPAQQQPQASTPEASSGQASADPSRQQRATSSDPATPVAKKGPGAYAKGEWNQKWSVPALTMEVPILPGINVGGSLEVGAGIGAQLGAAMTKLDSEGNKDRYQLSGQAQVSANGFVKAGLHASVGSAYLFSIQAGFFAKAAIEASAKGAVSGVVVWDNDTNRPSLSSKVEEKPKIDVKLATKLTAEVGAEIKARAFLIFEKKLYSYTFKTWELGNWMLQGTYAADADGNYVFTKTLSGFDKDGGLPTGKPHLEAKVVAPEAFLADPAAKIEDKYMAWRIYHDIYDPAFGYAPYKIATLVAKLKARPDARDVNFNVNAEGALKDGMDGLQSRPGKGMMTGSEWVAYSTTDALIGIKDRKTIKGVDAKLSAYHSAADNPARIKALSGTLTDAEVEVELAKVNLENPASKTQKLKDVFDRAGLIQVCDVYLMRNGMKNRAEMVAKLRMDAVAELERLKAL